MFVDSFKAIKILQRAMYIEGKACSELWLLQTPFDFGFATLFSYETKRYLSNNPIRDGNRIILNL
jgi:hypothetical protein